MKTYGAAFSARAFIPDGRGGRKWDPVTLPDEAMSVRSTLNGGTVAKTWTLTATSTHFEAGSVVMKLTGMVTGPNGLSTLCENKVRVDDGIMVAREVGINFEDRPVHGDRDFNDDVLCFKGLVSFFPTEVVSRSTQSISGLISHRSACDSDMRIEIVGPDDVNPVTMQATQYRWSSGNFKASRPPVVRLPFRPGSRLHVTFNPGMCGENQGAEKSMYDSNYASLKSFPTAGTNCNLTGK
jgi:hypothetical protein